MLEVVISLVVVAIILIAIFYIISIWIYKRAPSNMGFIRTGFLGTKVCLGKGAIVLPVFHDISWVSLETIKFAVSRAREQAILTADNIRVDVNTELYAHVGHTEDAVLTASRTLGEKTFDAEKVRNLLEAKVVGALRSFAATKTLKQLHENRDAFAREIKNDVSESFAANGLILEEVTIVALEQSTKEYFRSDNVFDAEGLKVITEITSEARRKVHTTEKQTTVAIRNKDLTTRASIFWKSSVRKPSPAPARTRKSPTSRPSSCARSRLSCLISAWLWNRGSSKTKKRSNSFAPSAISLSRPRPSVVKSRRCKRNWRWSRSAATARSP